MHVLRPFPSSGVVLLNVLIASDVLQQEGRTGAIHTESIVKR
jgi:hypothetical protein